jgi:hypothetical protein
MIEVAMYHDATHATLFPNHILIVAIVMVLESRGCVAFRSTFQNIVSYRGRVGHRALPCWTDCSLFIVNYRWAK